MYRSIWGRGCSRGLVIQWGRNGALYIDHVLVAESIQFTGRDAGFDKWCNIIKDFRRKPAGRAHGVNLFRGFEGNAHYSVLL